MSGYSWKFGNDTYILTEKQSNEVEEYSSSQPDDDLFNEWFLDYAEKNGIKPKHYGRAKYWSKVADTVDTVSRLVTVKQAASSLMKVVNPTIQTSEIKFDSPDSGLSIPSGPAMAASGLHDAMDNTAGFAIHSAFKETFSGLRKHDRQLFTSAEINKQRVSIYRALETLRVNQRGLKENPGFADYIESATDYTYNGYKLPEDWPFEDTNAQLAALLAPMLYGSRVGNAATKPYADKVNAAAKIVDSFIEPDNLTTAEVRSAINKIHNLLDIPPNSPRPMPIPVSLTGDGKGEKVIDEDTKQEVDKRISMEQETYENWKPIPEDGDKGGPLVKIRPPGVGKKIHVPGGIMKADAHLRLKKTLDKRTKHFQRSGDLDEDELYRLMQGDDRVFMNVEEEQEESAAIHFLVDASGSMGADLNRRRSYAYGRYREPEMPRFTAATQMAWLMAHSMNKRPHIKAHVWAHTGDSYIYGTNEYRREDIFRGVIVYDIWKNGEPLDRIELINQVHHANNYDGYAIDYVGRQLEQEDAEKKYLIVLSDGLPSALGYGGMSAQKQVRAVTDKWIKKGIHTVQIAIGDDLDPAKQADQFKYFVMYTDLNTTIKQFAKILDKAR